MARTSRSIGRGSNLANLTDWTATETCQFITAFQYHLFALDISGPGGTFPSLLRWSDAAAPGTIPASWTPSASTEAGDVELSDSPGRLLCAYPLRDSLIIYKRSAMYQAKYVGGDNVFNFRKVQAASGALTRRSVCDVNGQHVVVTDGDIIQTDGSNRRSLGEARVKDWLFNQLDQSSVRQPVLQLQSQSQRSGDWFPFDRQYLLRHGPGVQRRTG